MVETKAAAVRLGKSHMGPCNRLGGGDTVDRGLNPAIPLTSRTNRWALEPPHFRPKPLSTLGSFDYHFQSAAGRFVALAPTQSPVAQLVEQAAVNRRVVGSSPTGGALQILGTPDGTNQHQKPGGVVSWLLAFLPKILHIQRACPAGKRSPRRTQKSRLRDQIAQFICNSPILYFAEKSHLTAGQGVSNSL